MMQCDLSDRVAVVTGGASGIGRAAARLLARNGAKVFVGDLRLLDENAVEFADLGIVQRECDVRSEASIAQLLDGAVAEIGRLDILVNNAGITAFIPHNDFDAVDADEWDRIQAVNVRGPFQCARAARQALAADGGGEIGNIPSVAGMRATGSSIPYCTSKAALNNLTLTLARSMAPDIRVNAVAPGWVMTERQLRDMVTPEIKKKLLEEWQVLPYTLTPDMLAPPFLFLASDVSEAITRQTLIVDAGLAQA